VLDAALRQNIPLVYQCRSGSCSTCVARVVSGAIEMTPDRVTTLIPSEVADGKRLLCSSHAIADSVVSLHYPSTLIFEGERYVFQALVSAVEWPIPSSAKLSIAADRAAGFHFAPDNT
jgi:ferredoxin